MSWRRRTRELHDELAAIAELARPWWLLAAGAALAEPLRPRAAYVVSDADVHGDTFIGHPAPAPHDPLRDAIARAHAARRAIRELDGSLPGQPLAVTIDRTGGAHVVASRLDVAAFAIGDRILLARLADRIADEGPLATRLAAGISDATATPFVCISVGDEPISTARHGHRRAWTTHAGPWLGLSRAGGLALASTCHLAIDGYGHAWLAARIAAHTTNLLARAPAAPPMIVPALAAVGGSIPLDVAWTSLPTPAPRATPLAYALGRVLHARAGDRHARFSPTFQLPLAPGSRRHRVVYATLSVRFERGVPEPYEVFEARTRAIVAREANGRGLNARLLAAARAVPVPLAWKRSTFTAARPAWLDRIAEVVGGRACLSRMQLDVPVPASVAVSSPARLATSHDPGGAVVTLVDDSTRATLTVVTCSGAQALLDELLDYVSEWSSPIASSS